jgi:hypothetical protein
LASAADTLPEEERAEASKSVAEEMQTSGDFQQIQNASPPEKQIRSEKSTYMQTSQTSMRTVSESLSSDSKLKPV